jgi:hypothetical protein
MIVRNTNFMQDVIKRRLSSGSACHYLVQNRLFSCLLFKNIKIRIHKIIIFPVVLYGCEIRSLILSEDHRLRVFKKRVLRKIIALKGMKDQEDREGCLMRSFITCALCQI